MSLCYSSIPPSLTDLATLAHISQNMCSLITLLKALENLTEGSTMRVGGAPLFPERSHSLGRCQAAAHWEPSTGDTCEELHMHKSVMRKHRICMVSMEQGRELSHSHTSPPPQYSVTTSLSSSLFHNLIPLHPSSLIQVDTY